MSHCTEMEVNVIECKLQINWLSKIQFLAFQRTFQAQSHYRDVPQWGVSNGARHNWKCYSVYENFDSLIKKRERDATMFSFFSFSMIKE